MVHGNVHPGTVLIGDDGPGRPRRRARRRRGQPGDRHPGGRRHPLLRAHRALAARRGRGAPPARPDAIPDDSRRGGAIAAPRQVRAGVPAYLDDLTMTCSTPQSRRRRRSARRRAGRLDGPAEEDYLDDAGPLRFAADTEAEPVAAAAAGGASSPSGVAGCSRSPWSVCSSAINALGDGDDERHRGPARRRPARGSATGRRDATPAPQPQDPKLDRRQVRIVDPDSERATSSATPRRSSTATRTRPGDRHATRQPNFGNLKSGMGVLIDLSEPRTRQSRAGGAVRPRRAAELRTGTTDAACQLEPVTTRSSRRYKKAPIGAAAEDTTAPR